MQLAIDVQLPPIFGGPGGEALYIDTEGSFVAERAAEIGISAGDICCLFTSFKRSFGPDYTFAKTCAAAK